jgi:hypothetical protein
VKRTIVRNLVFVSVVAFVLLTLAVGGGAHVPRSVQALLAVALSTVVIGEFINVIFFTQHTLTADTPNKGAWIAAFVAVAAVVTVIGWGNF